jgi:hypothetical protein
VSWQFFGGNGLENYMEISKQINSRDKTVWTNISRDLLLGLLVGFAISLIIFLGFYHIMGAANLLEIVPMFFVLIFINTPYSSIFRLVELVPIVAPIISILITRGLVQKIASRKGWIFPSFLVAVTSAVAVVTITLVGCLLLGFGTPAMFGMLLLAGLLFTLVGFLVGVIPGLIFAPVRRSFKILIAVITSAMIGGFFEMAFLFYITRQ